MLQKNHFSSVCSGIMRIAACCFPIAFLVMITPNVRSMQNIWSFRPSAGLTPSRSVTTLICFLFFLWFYGGVVCCSPTQEVVFMGGACRECCSRCQWFCFVCWWNLIGPQIRNCEGSSFTILTMNGLILLLSFQDPPVPRVGFLSHCMEEPRRTSGSTDNSGVPFDGSSGVRIRMKRMFFVYFFSCGERESLSKQTPDERKSAMLNLVRDGNERYEPGGRRDEPLVETTGRSGS